MRSVRDASSTHTQFGVCSQQSQVPVRGRVTHVKEAGPLAFAFAERQHWLLLLLLRDKEAGDEALVEKVGDSSKMDAMVKVLGVVIRGTRCIGGAIVDWDDSGTIDTQAVACCVPPGAPLC